MSKKKLPILKPLSPLIDAHTYIDNCIMHNMENISSLMDLAEITGVSQLIALAYNLYSARWVTVVTECESRIYGAVALHPSFASELNIYTKYELEKLADHQYVVAIGKTGIDLKYKKEKSKKFISFDIQQKNFIWHINLAKRTNKPLIICSYNADNKVLDVLNVEGFPNKVVFNCFSSGPKVAQVYINSGQILSFSGIINLKRLTSIKASAIITPLKQLLIGSSTSFLFPHSFYGVSSSSYCLMYIIRTLAKFLDRSAQEIAFETSYNASNLYNIPTRKYN